MGIFKIFKRTGKAMKTVTVKPIRKLRYAAAAGILVNLLFGFSKNAGLDIPKESIEGTVSVLLDPEMHALAQDAFSALVTIGSMFVAAYGAKPGPEDGVVES